MTTIKVNAFDPASIQAAIDALKLYNRKLRNNCNEIAKRLAHLGYDVAASILSGHIFSGETIESLKVERVGNGKYVLYAQSTAILFFEFGAGVREGYGHPKAAELGMGPGTYPGKGHWDDKNGWWFYTDDPRLTIYTNKDGRGVGHSYGNRPHMPFYAADQQIRADILRVAKEVFAND